MEYLVTVGRIALAAQISSVVLLIISTLVRNDRLYQTAKTVSRVCNIIAPCIWFVIVIVEAITRS